MYHLSSAPARHKGKGQARGQMLKRPEQVSTSSATEDGLLDVAWPGVHLSLVFVEIFERPLVIERGWR